MANTPYYGTIPNIAQAFQNDPRTKLAQSALALGTSTAPVATGGWAVTDGLARAAQAIAGAVINKHQEKKYAAREQAAQQALAGTAQLANTPQPAVNPAVANPGASPDLANAVNALAGGAPASMPPAQSPASVLQNGMAGLPPAGPQIAAGGAPSPAVGGLPDPISGGTGPKRGAPPVSFINPLGGAGRATSSFGQRGAEFHNGQDWAAQAGTAIMAAADGVVIAAGNNKRSGNFVRIQHPDGSITGYAHLKDAPEVTRGQQVAGGSVIGAVGSTGHSTGNHLHFTVTAPGGTKVDPTKIRYAEATQAAALPGNAGTGITPPQYEARPDAPAMPGGAPAAPQLPQEVQSNRIAMAQQLLQSGNPDLMQIAQTYLDKGLDEQYDARRQANQQQFQQGQTGYGAELNDWQNARSEGRSDAYARGRAADDRNFRREETYNNQTFQAGQAQVGREFQHNERLGSEAFDMRKLSASQAFQAQQAALDRKFQSEQGDKTRATQLEVAGIRRDAAGQRQQQRNAYFSTPTGLKMQEAAGNEIKSNAEAIDKYRRFLDLNDKVETGGAMNNIPLIAGTNRVFSSSLTEMNAIANDTTLAKLDGSLGTAISDGDRRFIADSNVGVQNPREANRNIAAARIGALQRKNDYLVEFANAQADGGDAQRNFQRNWNAFVNAVPIVQYDKAGKPVVTDKPMTYGEWISSRPQFDKNGKRIK